MSDISEMDLDNLSCDAEDVVSPAARPRRGSLVLRCADCSSVVLVEYGQGDVPQRLRLPDLSGRSNGIAITNCRRCFIRTKSGREGRARVNQDQYRMTRCAAMCPKLWDASDYIKAAALVLEESVALMMVGRVGFHISWDLVSKSLDARDRIVSLDISQVVTGDPGRVILPYLAGNWV